MIRTGLKPYLIVAISSCLLVNMPLLAAPLSTFIPEEDGLPTYPIDTTHIPNPTLHYEPKSMLGNPKSYQVNGQEYYVLDSEHGYAAIGTASWYGTKFHGRRTSNGEIYNMYSMTAASPDLPLPSYVKVTNLTNHKQVIVRVNDRGPFHKNRLIDLSYAAAKKLGMLAKGTASVRIEAIEITTPTTSQQRQLYLQAGAFHHLGNAKHELNRLKNILIDAPLHLKHSQTNKQALYKIIVGPINTIKMNHQWLQRLQLAGIYRAYPIRL